MISLHQYATMVTQSCWLRSPCFLKYLTGLYANEQVDVFSFGIVLWEILTGEEPYANMHYGAIIGLSKLLVPHISCLRLGFFFFIINSSSCGIGLPCSILELEVENDFWGCLLQVFTNMHDVCIRIWSIFYGVQGASNFFFASWIMLLLWLSLGWDICFYWNGCAD